MKIVYPRVKEEKKEKVAKKMKKLEYAKAPTEGGYHKYVRVNREE